MFNCNCQQDCKKRTLLIFATNWTNTGIRRISLWSILSTNFLKPDFQLWHSPFFLGPYLTAKASFSKIKKIAVYHHLVSDIQMWYRVDIKLNIIILRHYGFLNTYFGIFGENITKGRTYRSCKSNFWSKQISKRLSGFIRTYSDFRTYRRPIYYYSKIRK